MLADDILIIAHRRRLEKSTFASRLRSCSNSEGYLAWLGREIRRIPINLYMAGG